MSRFRLFGSILVVLLIIPATAPAQSDESAVLTGRVVSEETGRPIPSRPPGGEPIVGRLITDPWSISCRRPSIAA